MMKIKSALALFVFVGTSMISSLAVAQSANWILDQNGCKVWNPSPKANETITWSGECVNGIAAGTGVLKWFKDGEANGEYSGELREGNSTGKGSYLYPNGSRYEGDFINGKRTGKGRYVWSNGNRYEGEVVDGAPSGKGIFFNSNGNRYEGNFVKGVFEGKGTYFWSNGDRYDGDFSEGKVTGKGVYLYSGGNRYEGGVVDNKRTGYGEERVKNGSLNRGIWANGKLERSCSSDSACAELRAEVSIPIANCKVLDSDLATEYRGECRNGMAHGKGRAKGKDSYVGGFKDGKKHGDGTYSWSGGSRYVGEWNEDHQTGFGTRTYSCSCGFWSCSTCEDTGWWKSGKIVHSCQNKTACLALVAAQPTVEQAQAVSRGLRCEEALALDRKAQALDGKKHSSSDHATGYYTSFSSCSSEREFVNLRKSSDPQQMYLKAAEYETKGERSRAKTLYQEIMTRHAKSAVAIKAADRITRMGDVEAIEATGQRAAAASRAAADDVRKASYDQCMNEYSACQSRCSKLKNSSSCSSGCALCTR